MSKKARKLETSSPKITTKRKCLDKKLINDVHQTENLFWPEDDEDSFFTVSKLNYEINDKICSLDENNTNLFRSQMTMGSHQEVTLFGTQQNSSGNYKEDTFFYKSVLDTVPTAYEEIIEKRNDNGLSHNHHDDKSFLSVSAVENLISNTPLELFTSPNKNNMTDKTHMQDTATLNMESSNNFHRGTADDSMFNTINLPSEQKGESQKQLKFDDTIFANINIEDLTKDEEKELFAENKQNDAGVQNSQRFLDDVAIFKVPQAPAPIKDKAGQKIKVPQRDTVVSGSQYAVHSDLPNITSLSNLSRLDWDSQAFSDKLENDFPSKGEFFGLPDKVKRMIFEHKGIQRLYGEY